MARMKIGEPYTLNLYGSSFTAYYSGKVECCNKCDCCGKHLENAHEFLFYTKDDAERKIENVNTVYYLGAECVKKCIY